MRTQRSIAPFAACLLTGLLIPWAPGPVAADEGISGEIMLGYRFVDVGGREEKYREDINLDEGPLLFGLHVGWNAPRSDEDRFADQIRVDLDSIGGDAYESMTLTAKRYGEWSFDFRRTESDYFYEDIILPHDLASVTLSSGGDFHHWDVRRVRDKADLKLWLGESARLLVGFDRYRREGLGATTLDISRDEFELESVFDENRQVFSAALEFDVGPGTLIVQESYEEFDNPGEWFLPGASLGENPTGAELDFYFFDFPYERDTNTHTLRYNARPTDRLTLSASAILQSSDLSQKAREEGQGLAFTGAPLVIDETADGDISRDVDHYQVDADFVITDRVALFGSVRQQTLDQDGRITYAGSSVDRLWEIDKLGVEVGTRIAMGSSVSFSIGGRYEDRSVDHGEPGEELEARDTDQTGLFAGVAWKPNSQSAVQAEYENSTFDDPFATSSPTDRDRITLKGRFGFGSGFSANGEYRYTSIDNDDTGWTSEQNIFSARLGYRNDAIDATFGYTFVDVERAIDQTITTLPGFGGGVVIDYPAIFYETDSDFLDARIKWTVAEAFALGGDIRFYDNSGTFALDREDFRVWAEGMFMEHYRLRLAYRTIDYNESDFDWDDYDADVIEVGIGYRW